MKLTNQEAIEQLKLNNPFMAGKEKELFSQAIDKGIEALENQKSVIEELEKIKAEIDEIVEREMKENKYWSWGLRHSKKIIDNHIKELKGENKKECSTCKSDNSHENCLGCIEYGHWELKGENNG